MANSIRVSSGLRPIGSRRIVSFGVGESRVAATTAQVGDLLSFALVANMTDAGLDLFCMHLKARGLDFGEVSQEGPTEHAGKWWIVYAFGDPRSVMDTESP